MKLAGKTDVGRVRQENQDDYRAGELPGGAVWALVCDGMGGAKGGREASQGACNVIEQVFQEQYAQCGAGQEGAFLKKALISANRYVFNKAAHEESLAGMGTTAVCALVRGGEATLCHAGDSRAYLCRGGKLTQLTHDHSYVQELVDCGTITVEEAEHHPQKNIITRAMQPGKDNRCKPSVVHITDLRPGDYLYICSDGMLEQMDNDALCQLFSSQDSDEAKRQQLIEATKGNKDNHSAYFVGIASVSSGEGDESLLDDEQTSKDNALNIRPVFEAEEVASDVEEVSVVEESPRVGQPLRPQPQAPKGGKGKLVLGAAAALAALACAYFFLTPKEEKAAAPLVPHTEKIGDSPSRQSADPARETVAREVRVEQPASSSSKSETTVRRETAPQKASPAEPQKNPASGKADPKKDRKTDKAGSTLESSKGAKTLPPPSMRQRKAEDPIDAAREKLKGAPQGGQKQKSKPSEGIPV